MHSTCVQTDRHTHTHKLSQANTISSSKESFSCLRHGVYSIKKQANRHSASASASTTTTTTSTCRWIVEHRWMDQYLFSFSSAYFRFSPSAFQNWAREKGERGGSWETGGAQNYFLLLLSRTAKILRGSLKMHFSSSSAAAVAAATLHINWRTCGLSGGFLPCLPYEHYRILKQLVTTTIKTRRN